MTTRKVYRVEAPDGTGPFAIDETEHFFNDLHPFTAGKPLTRQLERDFLKRFPPPHIDPKLKAHFIGAGPFIFGDDIEFRWSVGCCSKEQLADWFPPSTAGLLDNAGMGLTTWEVPDDLVIEGEKQALFDREDATLLSREPIAALYT